MPTRTSFILVLLLFALLNFSYPIKAQQDRNLIIRDDTGNVDIDSLNKGATPLLARGKTVALYVEPYNDKCQEDFEESLKEDNLLEDNQVLINVIAIFYTIPSSKECTFIRTDLALEHEIGLLSPDGLDGLASWLAYGTPYISNVKTYTDTEIILRLFKMLNQILWLVDIKPHIAQTSLFVYDPEDVIDENQILSSSNNLTGQGIKIRVFMEGDPSLDPASVYKYLEIEQYYPADTCIIMTIQTTFMPLRWVVFNPQNWLVKTFQEDVEPKLQAGMEKVERGESSYTEMLSTALSSYQIGKGNTATSNNHRNNELINFWIVMVVLLAIAIPATIYFLQRRKAKAIKA